MHDPIAYTYEADTHCPGCALQRFGRCAEHGQIACCVSDSEGNEPGAVAPWDEWHPATRCEFLVCGTCGEIIEESHSGNECECERERGEGNHDQRT